jgi:FkbM family methyltransferase
MKEHLFRLANTLYSHCYPIYYPLYTSWKAFSDRRERELFRQLIKPGMTVVDVGANIGVYTRYFSRLTGPSGQVHAFEPAPLNFQRLRSNVGGLPNVTLNQTAVGSARATLKLFVSTELNVDHRTFDSGDGRSSVDVPATSLDAYFETGQSVDLMKIDVQGFEMSVLEGARRVFEDNPGLVLLLEFWPYGLAQASVSSADLLGFIATLGFEARSTMDPTGPLFDPSNLDARRIGDYCNLILSKPPSAQPIQRH